MSLERKLKTKKKKLYQGYLIGNSFSEWYLPKRVKNKNNKYQTVYKRINLKPDQVPPEGSIERWRDAKTGQLTNVPPEGSQFTTTQKTMQLRAKEEGSRTWKSLDSVHLGRSKVKLALFKDGKILRYIQPESKRVTRSEVALYKMEEYETAQEGRAFNWIMEGETVKDCLKKLKIGNLGWGACLYIECFIKYESVDQNTGEVIREKTTVQHAEDFVRDPNNNKYGVPTGETFQTILINNLARKIRQRFYDRKVRFTEIPEMDKRLFSEHYWDDGTMPPLHVLRNLSERWKNKNQITKTWMKIQITRIALPYSSEIRKENLRQSGQVKAWLAFDYKKKQVLVFEHKTNRDAYVKSSVGDFGVSTRGRKWSNVVRKGCQFLGHIADVRKRKEEKDFSVVMGD